MRVPLEEAIGWRVPAQMPGLEYLFSPESPLHQSDTARAHSQEVRALHGPERELLPRAAGKIGSRSRGRLERLWNRRYTIAPRPPPDRWPARGRHDGSPIDPYPLQQI